MYGEAKGSLIGTGQFEQKAPNEIIRKSLDREPPMATALSMLRNTISEVDTQIDELYGRLSPVLVPEGPMQPTVGQCRDSIGGSPLVAEMESQVGRLRWLCERLSELRHRIEI